MADVKRFLFVISFVANLIGSYLIGYLGFAQWVSIVEHSSDEGDMVFWLSWYILQFLLGIRFLVLMGLLWAIQDNLLKAFERLHIKYAVYAAIFLTLPFLARFFPYSNLQDNFMISLMLLICSLPLVLLHYRLRQAARESDGETS